MTIGALTTDLKRSEMSTEDNKNALLESHPPKGGGRRPSKAGKIITATGP